MIRVENLSSVLNTKSGYNYVLNDVSMELNSGKTIGIIGESGSGKTQLMLAVTGSQPLTPGIFKGKVIYNIEGDKKNLYPDLETHEYELFLRNNNYFRKHQHRFSKTVEKSFSQLKQNKIGFIPQDPRVFLNPYWTIGMLFRQVYQKIKPHISFEDFFDKYILKVQLDPNSVINQYPHELSGGMAQRVMIAFILSQEPEIIIGDECTTGLDVGNQKIIIDLLKTIKNNNPTITLILISHDIGFLNHLVDEIYVMYGGFLIEYIKNKNRLFRDNGDLHPYTQDLRKSLIPKSEHSIDKVDELTSEIRLDISPKGCPYSYSGQCEIYAANESLDCKNKMPEIINLNNTSGDSEANLDKDWIRCWGYSEQ